MFLLDDAFSSPLRPVIAGEAGTVCAENPLAVSAGLRALERGGSAADAAIAAQAVLAVIAPEACGLGGDMLALVHASGTVTAINGTGALPLAHDGTDMTGARAITVPGLVGGWARLSERFGRLPLSEVLTPAIRLAEGGFRVSTGLARALEAQRDRLIAGGGADWPLFDATVGQTVALPRLGAALRAIADDGPDAFYTGPMAEAIAAAVHVRGGLLSATDLAAFSARETEPNRTGWNGLQLHTQPPMTQGILLNMVLAALGDTEPTDHACVELTEAAFAFRARAGEGMALMTQPLTFDPQRAANRGGPRAYLHTAGVAAADASGMVVSSLVSVFDDFGAAVHVPKGAFMLNNRGAGFGEAPNHAAPGKHPVHTLAPALLTDDKGNAWALATPGADGQIQTLLQVLVKSRRMDLARAVAAPRWRSENGFLLVEDGHPETETLAALGHRVRGLPAGDLRFGGLVVAGVQDGQPRAVADWRRQTHAGAV